MCIIAAASLSGCAINKIPDAIIILPGIMGSEIFTKDGEKLWINTDSIENIVSVIPSVQRLKYKSDDGFKTSDPIINDPASETKYGTFDTYKPLYQLLYESFKDKTDVVFFSYDWRENPYRSSKKLDKFISDSGYGKVTLIGHSMGGLVASQYIALGKDQEKTVSKLITLGTPYLGSPLASEAMLSGRIGTFAISALIAPVLKDVCPHIPSLYALLPFEQHWQPTLKRDGDNVGSYEDEIDILRSAVSGWNEEFYKEAVKYNKYMFTENGHITDKVKTYYIAGNGEDTVCSINASSDNTFKYEKDEYGDGTVPYRSATINNTVSDDRLYVKYSSDSKSALHADLAGGDDMTTPIFIVAIINDTFKDNDDITLRSLYGITKQSAKK